MKGENVTVDRQVGWMRNDEWIVCMDCLDASEAVEAIYESDMELEELCVSCWKVMQG